MKNTTAHIIAIGDEILYGDTLDTNSNFIAKKLREIHIELSEISIIKDDETVILESFKNSKANIIITTGGLGPTRDDKTKKVLSTILGQDLVMNKQALVWVENYYKKSVNKEMNELNRNQAMAPIGSTLLQNKMGTAPAIWTKWGGKTIINLPGVPSEMKHLMTEKIIPKIIDEFHTEFILHHYIFTSGIPESELAEKLESFEDSLPKSINLAYLPSKGRVKLRLTTRGSDKSTIKKRLLNLAQEIQLIIPKNIVANDININDKIAKILKAHNLKLATAESFTGGNIASSIIKVPGSSQYFTGGIVAYSPYLKNKLLNVSSDLIESKGVANEIVAEQMALGALSLMDADIAISSTGVAGPGEDEFGTKPGIAFLGIAYNKEVVSFKYNLPNLSRQEFTEKLTSIALEELVKFLDRLL